MRRHHPLHGFPLNEENHTDIGIFGRRFMDSPIRYFRRNRNYALPKTGY